MWVIYGILILGMISVIRTIVSEFIKVLRNRKMRIFIITYLAVLLFMFGMISAVYIAVDSFLKMIVVSITPYSPDTGLFVLHASLTLAVFSTAIVGTLFLLIVPRVAGNVSFQKYNDIPEIHILAKDMINSTLLLATTAALSIGKFLMYPGLLGSFFIIIYVSFAFSSIMITAITYIRYGEVTKRILLMRLVNDECFNQNILALNEHRSFAANSDDFSKDFWNNVDFGIYEVSDNAVMRKLKRGEEISVFIPDKVLALYQEMTNEPTAHTDTEQEQSICT